MSERVPDILIWVEPHPIRNLFDAFTRSVVFLADALQAGFGGRVNVRLSASEMAKGPILALRPSLERAIVDLTDAENAAVRANFTEWQDEAIADWLAIVRGERRSAALYDLYDGILERILAAHEVDLILIWSDNGLVRNVAARHGIPVLSGELGPTRTAFGETFYIDPVGTNGLAAIRDFPMALVADEPVLPPQTWPAMARASVSGNHASDVPGVLELERYGGKPEVRPAGPYAFVPLQLADDLNTLLHSPFRSPLAFLQHVVPLCRAAGLEVVVKGHPGVAGGQRPQNLVAEHEALVYAAGVEGVHILPRGTPADVTMPLVGNAAIVLTINSSMGFEAVLLGRAVATFGDAAFDVGGRLKRDLDAPAAEQLAPLDFSREAALLWRHYLHPHDPREGGRALRHIVELTLDKGIAPLSDAYWRRWIALIDHGREEIERVQATVDPHYIGRAVADGTMTLERVYGAFRGHIDRVESAVKDGARCVGISGWVTTQHVPGDVRTVALVSGEAIVATSHQLSRSESIAAKIAAPDPVYRFTMAATLGREDKRPLAIGFIDHGGRLETIAFVTGGFGAGTLYNEKRALERDLANAERPYTGSTGTVTRLVVERQASRFDVRVEGAVDAVAGRGGPAWVALVAGGAVRDVASHKSWRRIRSEEPCAFCLEATMPAANDQPLDLVVFHEDGGCEVFALAEGPLRRSAIADAIAALGAASSAPADTFTGHVDEILVAEGGEADTISLKGWLYGAETGATPQGLVIALDGRPVAATNLFVQRRDVAASHGLSETGCGIRMTFAMPKGAMSRAKLVAIAREGAAGTYDLVPGRFGHHADEAPDTKHRGGKGRPPASRRPRRFRRLMRDIAASFGAL